MNYSYNYGYNAGESAAAAGLAGVIVVLIIFIVIISLAFAVIGIVGQWKMFKKANEEGWKAIIPIYNTVIQCKLVGVTPWWILIVFVVAALTAVPFIGTFISILCSAAALYFTIILSISTARSYNKSDTFGIGYIFNITKPFFYLATGISETANYVGPKPMADPVWEWLVKTFGGKSNSNVASNSNNVPEADVREESNQSRFCSNCGAKVEGDNKFCSSCGKEV